MFSERKVQSDDFENFVVYEADGELDSLATLANLLKKTYNLAGEISISPWLWGKDKEIEGITVSSTIDELTDLQRLFDHPKQMVRNIWFDLFNDSLIKHWCGNHYEKFQWAVRKRLKSAHSRPRDAILLAFLEREMQACDQPGARVSINSSGELICTIPLFCNLISNVTLRGKHQLELFNRFRQSLSRSFRGEIREIEAQYLMFHQSEIASHLATETDENRLLRTLKSYYLDLLFFQDNNLIFSHFDKMEFPCMGVMTNPKLKEIIQAMYVYQALGAHDIPRSVQEAKSLEEVQNGYEAAAIELTGQVRYRQGSREVIRRLYSELALQQDDIKQESHKYAENFDNLLSSVRNMHGTSLMLDDWDALSRLCVQYTIPPFSDRAKEIATLALDRMLKSSMVRHYNKKAAEEDYLRWMYHLCRVALRREIVHPYVDRMLSMLPPRNAKNLFFDFLMFWEVLRAIFSVCRSTLVYDIPMRTLCHPSKERGIDLLAEYGAALGGEEDKKEDEVSSIVRRAKLEGAFYTLNAMSILKTFVCSKGPRSIILGYVNDYLNLPAFIATECYSIQTALLQTPEGGQAWNTLFVLKELFDKMEKAVDNEETTLESFEKALNPDKQLQKSGVSREDFDALLEKTRTYSALQSRLRLFYQAKEPKSAGPGPGKGSWLRRWF